MENGSAIGWVVSEFFYDRFSVIHGYVSRTDCRTKSHCEG